MSLLLNLKGAAGGGGGVRPVDPATLSPSEHYDESVASARANNNWTDKIGGTVRWNFGAGAASLFAQTQNGLTYYETDNLGTPFGSTTTPRPFVNNDQDASFIWVVKVRATNPGSDWFFKQTGENANVEARMQMSAGGVPTCYFEDKSKNVSSLVIDGDIRDNDWKIYVITFKNASTGELIVYKKDLTSANYTPPAWVASHFNGALWAGENLYGTPYCAWTGIAELIFWRNKILTAEEAQGVILWLKSKWAIT